MYLDQNIKINSMADKARKTFESTDKRLENIERNFHSKMRGRTMKGAIGSFFGTALWIIVAIIAAINYPLNVDNIFDFEFIIYVVTFAIIGLLLINMIIDEIMNFKFLGEVSSYGLNVSQLRSRIKIGSKAINANVDTYIDAKNKGWDYNLDLGESILDETEIIEGTLSSMDSLKNGFINSFKTKLYYITAIIITFVGSNMLSSTAAYILTEFFEISNDAAKGFCIVAMIGACVAEIFIAKLFWSRNECNVTNITLFGMVIGPVAFIALILVGSLVVGLVYIAIQVVIAIIGFAIAIACICGMASGG